jgi:large conductance mechanosensitive channel
MKNFIEEFKAFAMRGNVVDLAVAVVIGTAFGKIVTSLVENIVTPLIGVLLGGVDFTGYAYTVGEGEAAASIAYGMFIQSVFDFVIIALAIFVAIKALSKLQKKEAEKPAEPAATPEDIQLLREIRDSLKRQG